MEKVGVIDGLTDRYQGYYLFPAARILIKFAIEWFVAWTVHEKYRLRYDIAPGQKTPIKSCRTINYAGKLRNK